MTQISEIDNQTNKVKVLAVSTYELGHQPLILAQIASVLTKYDIEFSVVDNSVANYSFNTLDDFMLPNNSLPTHLIISVPMHTATQLGKSIAAKAKKLFGEDLVTIAIGLYAKVAAQEPGLFDIAIPDLDLNYLLSQLNVNETLDQKTLRALVPDRTMLPGLGNYAHFISSNSKELVGYVETTVGCAHMCRHCPVPVIHKGSFKAIPVATVMSQIDTLYHEGARHITFGDPDFLNGPTHALKILRQMHTKYSDLTFDATIKVEHVLENLDIWDEMRELGLQFIVSAFEHTSDIILKKLAKGHTKNDIVKSISVLRRSGIEVRPSLLPFTPWTTREDLVDLIDFIFEQDLVANVDPVQLSIKLLIPLDSLLLEDADLSVQQWNSETLSFEWNFPDPAIDQVHKEISQLIQKSESLETNSLTTLTSIREIIYSLIGIKPPFISFEELSHSEKPRLSESWFCCAEPTINQLNVLRS